MILANEAFGASKERLFMTLGSDHLLEHGRSALNFLDNVLGEQSLGQDGQSLVLRFNSQVLRLEVDVNVIDFVDSTILFGSFNHPSAKEFKAVVGFFADFFFGIDDKSTLEIRRQLVGTSLDSGLGSVDGPFNFLGLDIANILGFVDATGQFIIAAGVHIKISIVVSIGAILGIVVLIAALTFVAISVFGFFACFAVCLPGCLVFLTLLGLILEDEGGELKTQVDVGDLSARLAVQSDVIVFDVNVSLWILAFLAEHKFGDEAVKIVLKLTGFVGTVDNPAVVGGVGVGLSTEFKAKVLDEICSD
jgi:hypothetical protein